MHSEQSLKQCQNCKTMNCWSNKWMNACQAACWPFLHQHCKLAGSGRSILGTCSLQNGELMQPKHLPSCNLWKPLSSLLAIHANTAGEFGCQPELMWCKQKVGDDVNALCCVMEFNWFMWVLYAVSLNAPSHLNTVSCNHWGGWNFEVSDCDCWWKQDMDLLQIHTANNSLSV